MTFYNVTDHKREWRGYPAAFTLPGKMSLLQYDVNSSMMENLAMPATVDGFFRPIIAINTHWHGIHQVGSTRMDGLAYITQRPIMPFQSFRYQFRAVPVGTHWYHTPQRTDGLLSALIVKELTADSPYTIDLPHSHLD